jgi:hypothetical protein
MAAIQQQYRAPAEPESYVWSFPGAPVRIHLSLAVVQDLQPRFRSRDAAAECGLLLGHADGLATVVSGFQPLAAIEASEIKSALAGLAASSGGLRAVGYYRAQRQEVLRLDEKDLAMAGAFFRGPHNVILLVHPAGPGPANGPGPADGHNVAIDRSPANGHDLANGHRPASDPGPANATFFFWDGGRLNGDFPFLEFPFDPVLLAAAEQNRTEAAHRRAIEIPAAVETPASGAKPRRRVFWKALAWTFLGACLGGAVIGMRFFPDKFRWPLPVFEPAAPSAVTVAPPAQRPSMSLRAERQNADLKLTWDREASMIANATSAVLSIEDGDSRRTIPLRATEVRAGSILYTPVSDQVRMELAVSTPADHVTESVLVLLPKTGPPQTLVARPPVHTPLSGSASEPPFTPPPAPAPTKASFSEPVKPFIPPPAPSRNPAPAIRLSEPPAVAGINSAPPVSAPLVSAPLWSGPPVAPPPMVRPAPAPVPAPAPQAPRPAPAVAPQYYPPEAITRVRPSFPPALKSVIANATTVEVVVTIDETGKVVKADAKPQPGLPPTLVVDSVLAARQWKFRPARRGDQPVPSQIFLRFSFDPKQ